MDRWVNVPHFPALHISFNDSSQSYTAQQMPYLPYEFLPTEYHYSWEIPLWVKEYNGSRRFLWVPQGI